MKYGIKQQKKLVFCANCGKGISIDGSLNENFCSRCGNPLKIEAITQKESEITQIESAFIEKLETVATTLKTDSLKEVLQEMDEKE